MVLHNSRYHPKVNSSNTLANVPFWDILKGQWYVPVGRILTIVPGWKERWIGVQLHTEPWTVADGLAGWSGIWKKHDWNVVFKGI